LHSLRKDATITDEVNPDQDDYVWNASRIQVAREPEADGETKPSIREKTLRAMMGEFGGNAGLVSAWFDYEANEWVYDVSMCSLGVQHVWWIIRVMQLITILLLCAATLSWVFGTFRFNMFGSDLLETGRIDNKKKMGKKD
jgi:hypothetical protein